MESNINDKLTHQQKRFCDEYLVSFNAFRAALLAGYSENTASKAELLHLPKIQAYLTAAMNKTASRLQITHDMILRELAKVAFASMGNYYDERGVLKPITELTDDQKAAINQYQILDTVDEYGERMGALSKIKLHNKMSALDKIARHLNFYGVGEKSQDARSKNQEDEVFSPEPGVFSPESEILSMESGVFTEDMGVIDNVENEEAKCKQLERTAAAAATAADDSDFFVTASGERIVMWPGVSEPSPLPEDADFGLKKNLTLSPPEEKVRSLEPGVRTGVLSW